MNLVFTITVFQFHDGTIKSDGLNPFEVLIDEFQFHDGTIKSRLDFKKNILIFKRS
jgi:hypothetical protein